MGFSKSLVDRDQMQSVKSPRQLRSNYAHVCVRARVLRDVLMAVSASNALRPRVANSEP